MKEDKLAAGRCYHFLFQESQHIYSPVHHLKFKRHPKEKLLPDPDDYSFNIPYHSLNDPTALKGFLDPLCKPVPLIRGHNPVDPTKLDDHYYLQYDPNLPHLPSDIRLHIANRQDLNANDANNMGTTLKHFYRRAMTTRQITVYTKTFHKYMKQPPLPPKPSKKKQHNKWKKWMEKH
ncbi:unnamed protein product [Rhizophagus irregularis]|nr:unnamed protein product [Rhizophagus irregularis]